MRIACVFPPESARFRTFGARSAKCPQVFKLFGQAPSARAVDVHRQHSHPMPLQVLDEHARVVEAHGLVVEKATTKLDRMIELQPCSLIGGAREGGCV